MIEQQDQMAEVVMDAGIAMARALAAYDVLIRNQNHTNFGAQEAWALYSEAKAAFEVAIKAHLAKSYMLGQAARCE
jgi:hypothetical protein